MGIQEMKLKKTDTIAIFLFFLFGFFYYMDILLGKAFIWEDLLEFLYPLRNFLAVSIKQGRVPLWIPGIFSGMPFLEEPQTAVLYPFNLIFALFVKNGRLPYTVLEAQVILHLLFGGLGVYFLLRSKKLLPVSSLSGALVYSFSSFLVLHIIHGNLVNAAMWIPWLYWVFEIMVKKISLFYSGLLGLGLGVMASAGYPQLLVYFLLLLGALLIYWMWQIERWADRVKVALLFALAFIIFFGLWMWQLLPTSFMTHYTERQVLTFGLSAENSIPPYILLLKLLTPKIFGSVSGGGAVTFFGGPTWSYWEQGIYAGILPILLWGMWLFRKRRPKEVILFSVVAILSLWLASGKYGGLYQLFYYLIPPLRKFRNPPRFSVFFFFSLAIITGYAINEIANWIKGKKKVPLSAYLNFLKGFAVFSIILWIIVLIIGGKVRTYGMGSAVLFMVFSVLGTIFIMLITHTRNSALLWFLPLILALDLFLFGNDFAKGSTDPKLYYSADRLPKAIREDGGIFRLNIRKGHVLVLPRNAGAVLPFETIDGYEVLRLRRYIEFYDSVINPVRLPLLNVKYRLLVNGNERYMVPLEDFLKRGFFVDTVISVKANDVLKVLNSPDFVPDKIAITELPNEGDIFTKGTVKDIKSGPQSLDLDVSVQKNAGNRKGFLVVSLVQYPEWEATLDGKRVDWKPVDLTLMGLEIPQGDHHVTFKIRSNALAKGGKVSILTLFFSFIVIVIGWILDRRKTKIQQ